MTENKRYNQYCDDEDIRIRIDDDLTNKEVFHIYFAELEDASYCMSKLNPLVDLLNALNDENEQLKKQIGNLEHTRDFCADVCADCERLEKENKQLKFDKQQLHRAMSREEVRHKQFQDKVFALIDEKIKELSTTTKHGDIHEDLRIFAQQVLYDLKKELSDK